MAAPEFLPLPDLSSAVLALLQQVPRGRVTTFGDLAVALGDVAAARWVAAWLKGEWLTACSSSSATIAALHRVVLRTGNLPRWDERITAWQHTRLEADRVPFVKSDRVAPSARWSNFVSDRPLQRLQAWQGQLAQQADWMTTQACPLIVGGVDLSYTTPTAAVAAYVAVEVASGDTVFEHSVASRIEFPYINGYLTFRELPALLTLLQEVRQRTSLAAVILVDGTGRLHPRQCGLAVAVSVCGGCTTIGVAKHQLCGRLSPDHLVEGCPAIRLESQSVGAALSRGSRRQTAFISPGSGLDLSSAIRIVQATWWAERSPRPIARADALSRQQAHLRQT